MILELKGKLPTILNNSKNSDKNRNLQNKISEKYSDIKLMLESLGFAKKNIQELFSGENTNSQNFLEKIENVSDEEIVKIALQNL